MKSKPLFMIAFAAAAVVASPAGAHITLENRQATPASYYKAVFAVPHGCAGAPTPKLRWRVENVKAKYSTSYELHGATVTEGVKEVVWSGGKLADDNYDEFV